jgi:hypothetical protein
MTQNEVNFALSSKLKILNFKLCVMTPWLTICKVKKNLEGYFTNSLILI